MDEWKKDAEKPMGNPERTQSSARLAGFLLETGGTILFFGFMCNVVLFLAGILLLDLLLVRNRLVWLIVLPFLLLSLLVLYASARQMWGKVRDRRVE